MQRDPVNFSIFIFSTFLLASCGAGHSPQDITLLNDHATMLKADSAEAALMASREKNVRAVFRMYETGDPEGAENFLSENYVEHSPPPGMEVKGIQGFRDMVEMLSKSWSNNKMTINSIAQQGDMMFVHYNWSGDNTGEIMPGTPATGKHVSADGVEVLKFDGTKMTDHWGFFEEMKMMTQLSMIPDPTQEAAKPKKK